jgi:hypothetical protein
MEHDPRLAPIGMHSVPAHRQDVNLVGKKLYRDDKCLGHITQQVTLLGVCDQHSKCNGPIVRVSWTNRKFPCIRRECLYALINGGKTQLRNE